MNNLFLLRMKRVKVLSNFVKEIFDDLVLTRKTLIIYLILLVIGLLSLKSQAQNLNWAYNVTNNQWGVNPIGWKIDSQGNTYVAGQFRGDQSYDFDPGEAVGFPSSGGYNDDDTYDDIFIAKYNSSGNLVWVYGGFTTGSTSYGADPNLTLTAFDIDDDDNIYLAGYMQGTTGVYFFWNSSQSYITGQSTGTPATDWDGSFLIKINENGVEQWEVNTIAMGTDGTIEDMQYSNALDKVVVTGHFSGRHFSSFPSAYNSTYFANQETYLAHVDPSNGSYSNVTHIIQSGGGNQGNNNKPTDLWVDGLGNAYVLGTFSRTADFNPGASTNSLNPTSGGNFMAKYNGSNAYVWASQNTETLFDIHEKESSNVLVLRSDETYNRVIEEFNSSGSSQGEKFNSTVFQSEFHLNESDQIIYNEQLFSSSNGSYISDFYGFTVSGADDLILLKEVNTVGADFDPSGGIWQVKSDFISRDAYVLAKYTDVVDNTAPVYSSFAPVDGTYNVATDVDFVITFDEPVRPISNTTSILKKFYIRQSSDNAILDDVNVYGSEVSFSGNQIFIDLDSDLPDDTEMYVNFDDGFVIDYAGNQATGVPNFNKTIWNFSTGSNPDPNPPGIQSTVPLNSDSDVDVSANLTITFDEAVNLIGGQLIYIRYVSGGAAVTSFNTSSGNVSLVGSTLTLNPISDLPNNAALYVDFPSTAIEDLNGNAFPGTNASNWSFTTEMGDTTPPGILSVSPGNGGSNIAVDQNLVLLLNEAVQTIPSQNLYIRYVSDDEIFTQLNTSVGSTITISGNQVTLNPIPDLPYSTALYVDIPSGVFEDLSGNDFAGITTPNWNFTTQDEPDTENPYVLTYNPSDGSDDVAVDSDLILTFNEPIVKGGGNIQIHYAGGSLIEAISVTSGNVSISGAELTINPTSDLPYSSDVYVTVSGAAIDDENSNSFPGINDNSTWNFTTADPVDNQPPSISSLSPEDDATYVALDDNLIITFDEPVQTGSGNIQVKNSNGSTKETVTISEVMIDGNQVTINPDNDFFLQSEFYILIPDGFFLDLAGNAFEGISESDVWNFSTRDPNDVTGPAVLSISPEDGELDAALDQNIVITLDEDVQEVNPSSFLQIRGVSPNQIIENIEFDAPNATIDGDQIIIDPTNDFIAGKEYYIYLPTGVLEDLSGNQNTFSYTSNTDWNFTASGPPTITNLSPANNSTNVAVDSDIVLTFNKPVVKGMGSFEIRRASDDALFANYGINTTPVTFSGSTVTIDPEFDLPAGQLFFLTTVGDPIKDASNNDFAGLTSGDYAFTTISVVDNTGPDVASFEPSDNDNSVDPIEPEISVTFDEYILAGSGTVTLYTYDDDQVVQTFSIDGSEEDYEVQLNELFLFSDELEEGTHYYLTITSGAIKDWKDNIYPGFTDKNIWDFITTDDTPPEVVSYDPDLNATLVPTYSDLTLTFNEPVQLKSGGFFQMYNASTDELIGTTWSFNSAQFDGNSVTYDIPIDLPGETSIYFIIGNGIQDMAGNVFPTLQADDWTITTAVQDVSGPTIESESPQEGSANVALDANIVLTLNEPVEPVNASSFLQIRKAPNSIVENIEFDEDNVTFSGNTITIDPTNDFEAGTDYFIYLPTGVLQDYSGNANTFSSTTIDHWHFTTEAPALAITSVSPDFNSTNGHVIKLDVYFNQDIQLIGNDSDWIARLYRYSDDQAGAFAKIENATVNGNHLEMLLDWDPLDNEEVYVSFISGRIQDLQGNDFEIPVSKDFWKFTSDWNYVERTALQPENFSIQNSIDGEIKITYDQDIQKGHNGSYTLRKWTGNEVILSFDMDDPRVSIADDEVFFDVDDLLEYNTRYFITALGVPIRGVNGEPTRSFNNNTSFVFTIEPDPALFAQPVAFTPAHQSSDVAVDTDLIIEFTNPVTFGGYIYIYNRSTGSQIGSSVYTPTDAVADGNFATIPTNQTLPYETEIAIRVSSSAFISENHDVLAINDNDTWYFTTEQAPDTESPTISMLSPSDGSGSVPIDGSFTLTLNESVQKGTGDIEVRRSSDDGVETSVSVASGSVTVSDNEVTFSFPDDLNYATDYWIFMDNGALEDLAGNDFGINSNTQWQFTTVDAPDITAPTVNSLTPADDAGNVNTTNDLVVVFDENIMLGMNGATKQAIIRQGANVFQTIPLTAANISGNQLTIPHNAFEESTDYYVLILDGVIADLSNNWFGGFESSEDWSFSTGDFTVPQISTLSPTDNAVDVGLDDDLVMTFDEPIQSTGGGTFSMFNKATGQQIGPNWFFPAGATFDGSTVTYDIPMTLPYGTEIYINISNAIEDLAGNNASNINDMESWTFTTLENSDPTDITLTNNTVDENASIGLIIGTLGAVDPNGSDTHTFELVAGEGDADNEAFLIDNSFLKTQGVFDYETQNPLSIRVRATDNYDNYYEEALSIIINDVFEDPGNNDPTNITLAPASIEENEAVGSVVGQLSSTDADGGDTHVYSIVSGTGDDDNSSFEIDDDELISTESFDFEAQTTYNVRIRTTDNNGGIFEKSFVVSIQDVEERSTQIITFDQIEDQVYGGSFSLSASSSSGLDVEFDSVTGPITVDGDLLTIVGVGEATVRARQEGNTDYFPATPVEVTFSIEKAEQTITIDSIPDKTTTDDPFMASASVSSGLTLTLEVSGPATISGTEISLSGETGEVKLLVSQEGDENHLEARDSVSFNVNLPGKSSQAITFGALASTTYGTPYIILSATASSGLEVSYEVTSGPGTLSKDTLKISGAGEVVIVASQSGNVSFEPAESVSQTLTVNRADQIISINEIGRKLTTDAPFEIIASVDSELTLDYSVEGPATIDGNMVTLDGIAGNVTVTASQSGNNDYNPATASVSFVVEEGVVSALSDWIAQVNIYPNPSNGIFHLTLPGDDIRLFVIDLQGKVLFERQFNSGKGILNLTHLPKGIYVVRGTNGKQAFSNRIQIQ